VSVREVRGFFNFELLIIAEIRLTTIDEIQYILICAQRSGGISFTGFIWLFFEKNIK
jgi:hypothetical protein